MRNFLFAIITGLIGAALLHLIIILSLPYFSERDAFTRVLAEGELHKFHVVGDQPDRAGLAMDDPFIDTAVCGFDASDGPIRLTASGAVPFWSLAVYDPSSNEVFSINDRTSSGGALDVVIATPVQISELRKAMPEVVATSILIETTRAEGYVVLRSLTPRQSYAEVAKAFLGKATCAPFGR